MRIWLIFSLISFFLAALNSPTPENEAGKLPKRAKMALSEYGFFEGNLAEQNPAVGVLPYDLNTPLFSDYAQKLRFVHLPEGKTANYSNREVMDFPEGTTIIKTFYYPKDFRKPEKGRTLMETRLLLREAEGWYALPYIWNDEQTEAHLEVAGGTKEIAWKNQDGKKQRLDYSVPNINQCKGCHIKDQVIQPIGPTARQLNRTYDYADGTQNQLQHWHEAEYLQNLPPTEEWPQLAVWNKPNSGSLDQRARAYLDINCAHCHRDGAPANTSGLLLDYYQENATALGVNKPPVAAGRGSGGHAYDIAPGKPKESILWHRISSTDPGVRMPELGRQLVHQEGVALIEEWINSLPH